jgi:hypothetical protein
MRLDRVKQGEISISIYQREINKWVKSGLNVNQIQTLLGKSAIKFTYGVDNELVTLSPQIVLTPSNLGKGLIASFICLKCSARVRSLYFLKKDLSCRLCHHLTYKKEDRRQGIIKRLIFDENLREIYLASGKLSYFKMYLEAEFAREAIINKGYEIGENIFKTIS